MKPIPKKLISISLIIVIFLGLFLVNVEEAKAQLGWVLGGPVGEFLQGIFKLLLMIAQLFTGLVGNLFTKILNFGFRDTAMIYDAWMITRDIVNMFFILGLVVIAFATILRIETYGMKALLPKLIIIALLINFSFLVCGIIIDAAQVVTNHFIGLIQTSTDPNAPPDVGAAILSALKVTSAIKTSEGQTVAISYQDPEVTTTLNLAFSTVIIAVAGFVLLIGAVLLFIRIGALWALIILVPFAWFFSIFPGKLKTHASKWWDEFLKWTFFAPIYVFFIYLILKIGTSLITLTSAGESPDPLKAMALTEMMSNWNLLFYYVFLVILLLGAPMVAQSMGIQATGMAKTIVKGGLKGAYKLPGKLRGAAATVTPPAWMEKGLPWAAKFVRGVQKTAAFTSPEFWKKAMEARKAERQRKARIGYLIGKQHDVLNRVFSLFSEKTNFAEQAEQFEVAEKKKDVDAETKRVGPRLIAKLKEALKQRDVLTYKACMELLQEQGDTNDAMISDRGLFDDLKFDDKYALDKLKGLNVNDKKNRRFSNLGFKHGVIQQMRQMGLSDKQIAPFLGKLQEIALQAGYYGSYGMAATDDKGNVAIASDEDQIEVAAAKLRTQPARNRKLHGTAIGMQGVDEKGQYKFMGRDDVADELLGAYTLADVKETELRYVRPDAQASLNQAYEQGALKGISTIADSLGKKVNDAMTGKTATKAATKAGKKAGEEAGKKTKEEVKKELEDLGLK